MKLQVKVFYELLEAEGLKRIEERINGFLDEHPDAVLQHFGHVDRHGCAIWYAVVQYETEALAKTELFPCRERD